MIIETKQKKDISYWLVWILSAIIIYCHFVNPRLDNGWFTSELSWDIFSYYLYLPFTFIYHDIGMTKQEVIRHIFDTYNPSGTFYQAYKLDNGNWTPNYTCGFAMLWSPFFFIGHIWAKLGNYPADGWSFPYQFSIANGVLIYIIYGLFVLRKVLLLFFNSRIVALTLFFLVLGTNYLHEAFDDYLMPHAVVFTGYAMLLYYTIRWHQSPQKRYVIAAGLIMGFMVLSRPSEIVSVFIPLLWNVYDRESLKHKIFLVRTNFSHILLLLASAFVVFIPQLIYWKIVTGHFLFYSYQHTEGFDFFDPHIYNVLFSFKKSLLVYTPIIIFPTIGIFLLRKYLKPSFLPILIFVATNFYLLSSWAAWWNGGSFGMRYWVESFAVMAIPFGALIQYVQKSNVVFKYSIYIVLILLTSLNLFQTWQYTKWLMPADGLTFAYYKRIFLKTKVTDEDRKLGEVQRTYNETESFPNEQDYQHFTAGYLDFEKVNTIGYDENKRDTLHFLSPPYAYKFKEDDEWGPTFRIPYTYVVREGRDHAWMRISVNYFSDVDIKENPASLVINMPHRKYNLKYRGVSFEDYPFKKGEWNKLTFDYLTPFPYSEKDHFDIYVWHRGKQEFYIDDMCIETFEKKNYK